MQKIKLLSVFLILLCFSACKKNAQSDKQTIYGPLTSKEWSIDAGIHDPAGGVYNHDGVWFRSNGETYSEHYNVTAGKWVLQGDTIKFTFALSTFDKGHHYIGRLSEDKTYIRGIVYKGDDLNDKSLPLAYFQAYAGGPISGSSNMDIERAIAELNANALPNSIRRCAKYVRLALKEGKIRTDPHPIDASDYASFLLDDEHKFVRVTANIDDGTYIKKPGDVAVFERFAGRPHGHIQMYNGSDWVSDTKQVNFLPHTDYKGKPYLIIRP